MKTNKKVMGLCTLMLVGAQFGAMNTFSANGLAHANNNQTDAYNYAGDYTGEYTMEDIFNEYSFEGQNDQFFIDYGYDSIDIISNQVISGQPLDTHTAADGMLTTFSVHDNVTIEYTGVLDDGTKVIIDVTYGVENEQLMDDDTTFEVGYSESSPTYPSIRYDHQIENMQGVNFKISFYDQDRNPIVLPGLIVGDLQQDYNQRYVFNGVPATQLIKNEGHNEVYTIVDGKTIVEGTDPNGSKGGLLVELGDESTLEGQYTYNRAAIADDPVADPHGQLHFWYKGDTTTIDKTASDENGDNVAQLDEEIAYTISVTNTDPLKPALDVPVRDNLLEDLPSYITFNDDVSISNGSDYSGDLTDGTFKVESIKPNQTVDITYTLELNEIPDDASTIENIATDTNVSPEIICPPEAMDSSDCSQVIIPIEATTTVEKAVVDSSEDEVVQSGETLTYTLTVNNSNKQTAAYDVVVRDSMLENLPEYLTFNDDVTVSPNVETSGDLVNGDFTISEVAADSAVTITYSVKVGVIPEDVTEIGNVVTDNGQDPVDPTTELPIICEDDSVDCDQVTIPVDPSKPTTDPIQAETVIEKAVVDADGSGVAETGEVLTYTINVTNENLEAPAHNVEIKDSLMGALPQYLSFNNDLVVSEGIKTSGNLLEGNFVILELPADSTATITYSLTVADTLPKKLTEIENIVTDNGQDPNQKDFVCEDNSEDCDTAVIDVEKPEVDNKSEVEESEVEASEVEESEVVSEVESESDNHLATTGSQIVTRISSLAVVLGVAVVLKKKVSRV